jgi:WD40 repeat protein
MVVDRYWTDGRVRKWGENALSWSGQSQRLQVVGDRHTPRTPLVRDLGLADDFVPGIGANPGFGAIFSASMSGQLRRVETASGRLEAECHVQASVLCLQVIGEDNILLGLADGSVVAWDGAYGLRTAFCGGQRFSANAIAESPVEGRLLVGSGQWAGEAQAGCIHVLASSDLRVLSRLALDDRIVLEMAETWRQKRVVNPGGTQVNVIVRRPHSHEVAVAFHHGEVSLYDFDRDQWRRVYLNPRHAVYGLVCTTNGDRLIFTDGGSQLMDLDLKEWKTCHRLDLQVDLTALALAPEQNMLVVGDTRGMLYLVSADSFELIESFPAEVGGCVRSICCNLSGEQFAVSGRGVRLYRLPTDVDDSVAGTAWGWQAERADGSAIQRLCVGATSGWGAHSIHLDTSDIRAHTDLWSVRCARDAPIGLAWNPSAGTELVTLPELEVLARWDEFAIFGTAISARGDWAASISGKDREFSLSIYRLAPDGRQADLEKRLFLHSRPAAFGPVVFSDDGMSIAAVTAASARIVRERLTGLVQGRLEKCPGHVLVYHIPSESARTVEVEYPVGALAFSPDGSILFIAPGAQYVLSPIPGYGLVRAEVRHLLDSRADNERHAIRAYDVGRLDEIYRLEGHTDSVTAIQASPDSRELLSISDDRTLRLWDLASLRCDVVVGIESRPLWCAFSSEASLDVVWSGWRASARLLARRMIKVPPGSRAF